MEKDKEKGINKYYGIIKFVIIIIVISYLLASFVGLFIKSSEQGNVAIIKIWGPITIGQSEGLFSNGVASSEEIISLIEKADKNKQIKAIIFDINSPGGSPVGSDEIALAIKSTNKTTVSLIREVGASGAYWVASATDHIVANRMSVTGSIGAYSSYLEFAGLMDDYNITYRVVKSAKYKDAGSPFKEMTPEEMHMIQQRIDIIHNYFVEEIANNRNLSIKEVQEIANGMIYLGSEAKGFGLIDELGSMNEALKYIEQKEEIQPMPVEYKIKRSFMDSIMGILSFNKFSIQDMNEARIIT
jgi:protease IV